MVWNNNNWKYGTSDNNSFDMNAQSPWDVADNYDAGGGQDPEGVSACVHGSLLLSRIFSRGGTRPALRWAGDEAFRERDRRS